MTIRRYRHADREHCATLWVATWTATLPEVDFQAWRPWITDLLDRFAEHDSAVTLCAVAATDDPVGFVMLEPADEYLEQIAIAPEQRGAGVGTRLLDEAKRLSPARLALRVNQDNPRAARFYAREGFRITGEGVNEGGTRRIWHMEWRAKPG